MPLLHHAMRGTLAGNGQTIELAGKTDREIADINHLLHFAAAFGSDLAGLYHHQATRSSFAARNSSPRAGPVRRGAVLEPSAIS